MFRKQVEPKARVTVTTYTHAPFSLEVSATALFGVREWSFSASYDTAEKAVHAANDYLDRAEKIDSIPPRLRA
jgi:hypothetical protein